MPEVDPATLSRFAAATTTMASARNVERVSDKHVAINPSDREAVYRRFRRSKTHIGATFRGLEKEVGSGPALDIVCALVLRPNAEGVHGTA
ncbi:hypothetical protein V474_07695 [Novosphingobium barchaimii LL02]|uniref:Uncharacterized protein n=1 Tax=Novosphingobium barchaimii LL02 TaxID=1114963 RepID=A0A0J7Y8N7_9SPHN|nr:hypothetical protein [Novosphingobium barchaimii]KMS59972.1 hypothetical protein V474_07695 [Novosphingobium barchaimii LL02]